MDYSRKYILGNLKTGNYEDLFISSLYKKIIEGYDNENVDCPCRYCINAIQWENDSGDKFTKKVDQKSIFNKQNYLSENLLFKMKRYPGDSIFPLLNISAFFLGDNNGNVIYISEPH